MDNPTPIATSALSASQESSGMAFVVAMLILTVLAIGSGAVLALQTGDVWRAAAGAKSIPGPVVKARYNDATRVESLGSIITNLGGPSGRGIRLEGSIVLESDLSAGEAKVLAAKISEDILAYLRTITLAQLEGASGFQYLREDLNDRVRIRSDGKANELIIQSLIVE